MVPASRMLLETDNPGGYEWLTKRLGMPAILLEVFSAVSGIKGIDPESLKSSSQRIGSSLPETSREFRHGRNDSCRM